MQEDWHLLNSGARKLAKTPPDMKEKWHLLGTERARAAPLGLRNEDIVTKRQRVAVPALLTFLFASAARAQEVH